MGNLNGKIFLLILLLTAGFRFAVLTADDDASGAAASLTRFALPEYSRDSGRLQFILYGEKASNLGALLYLTNPKIDLVRDKVKNINDVVSLADAEPYPLTYTSKEVQKYWADKAHSQALIFSGDAEYDKNLRLLKSDAPVHFRSREISVDGIGFDADHERQFVHVRSKVRMVIYPEMRKYSGLRSPGEPQEKKVQKGDLP